MKHLILAALGALLMLGNAEAHLRPNPGQFGFEAEWIYYHTSFDSPYYVIVNDESNSDDLPNGERKANEPEWDSGYRIAAAYTLCECGPTLRARWTELRDHNKEREAGSLLLAAKGHPKVLTEANIDDEFNGTADSSLRFHYYSIEGEAAQHVLSCCSFDLFLFAGIQYSRVDLDHEIAYVAPSSPDIVNIKNMSRFWGVGPELGLNFDYDLWCGVRFTGRGSTSLLISKMKATTSQVGISYSGKATLASSDATLDARNEKIYRLVPSTNIRLGLTYGCSYECFGLAIEAGYEATSYIKALPSFPFVDNVAEAIAIDQYSNADFHGPYVNVSVTF